MKARFKIHSEKETYRHRSVKEFNERSRNTGSVHARPDLAQFLKHTRILRCQAIEINLKARETFRLEGDQRGSQILALQGLLWVTQEGDPKDYVLTAGERFTIDRPGMVVVQGLRETKFLLSSTGA